MGTQRNWAMLRKIAGEQREFRCYYCNVPTAATIEHVQARTKGGSSWLENLRIACPYCNSKKGDRPEEEFKANELWKIKQPEDMPSTTREMLKKYYGWDYASGLVSTGSTNSKLELKDGIVTLLVRAHKDHPWHKAVVGRQDSHAVAGASWDFLKRHNTPSAPKKRRPPKSAFAKNKKPRL